jgi:DNA-binding NtrC family response regulator
MLIRAFLARHGRPELHPAFGFMTAVLEYDWPHNVRELEACIKRCVALAEGPLLTDQQLPTPVLEAMEDYGEAVRGASVTPASLPPAPINVEPPAHTQIPTETELRALLEAHAGNVAAVGRQLGKARMQIHRWMKRYGIHIEDFRR